MRQIRAVSDPELDEPFTDFGFIESIDIDADDHVRIVFRLPTYSCAANLPFMMAEDIPRVQELPWVTGAAVELIDHFSAAPINQETAARLSFSATFPEELEDLILVFRSKAFLRRQKRLLRTYWPRVMILINCLV